jgi:hypothetical protein
MKLRRESVEKAEISGPQGEVEHHSSGPDRIGIHPGLKKDFRPERSDLSTLAAEGFMKCSG